MAGNNIGMRLYTWLNGVQVGQDSEGNRYYRERKRSGGQVHRDSLRRERRWVIYQGYGEPSQVPAEWHAWLHHMTDDRPGSGAPARRPWQQDHLPNMTGTSGAYRPPGHTLMGGRRAPTTGDYEPWAPE